MTQEELLEKYGKVKMHFSTYWKYSFTYKGKFEDEEITYTNLGYNDEIYRADFNDEMTLESLIKTCTPYCTILKNNEEFYYKDY